MSNTESLGYNYRGRAWNDGAPITRVTLGDGTIAEAMVALGYVWNGSAFVKIPGDATSGMKVQVTTGLVPGVYDFLSYTSATLTDTYVYKTGGSGGATVATVTVTWTDNTKTVLATVART